MRRLPLLCASLVLVDTMLYAALTPLLPHFLHEFGLSKSRAGTLVAAYATGALLGGIAGGVAASWFGPRRAVLFGLVLMGAASLGFGFAGDFWTLFGARLLQGLSGGFMWSGALPWLIAATPRERRGQALGNAMGAAVFGAMFGPVLGAAAALAGRATIFTALAAVSIGLAAWTLQFEPAPCEEMSLSALGRALREQQFRTGFALMALGSLLFGILGVLAPLHLARAGWGAAAIGAVWLSAAAIETAEAPLVGRLSDRRGPLVPTRVALTGAVAVTLLLAIGARPLFYAPLIPLAAISFAPLFTTAFALFANGAEEVGLAQGMGFGVMNAAWALGAIAGPAGGGAIAGATGDWIPFALGSLFCAFALAVLRPKAAKLATSGA